MRGWFYFLLFAGLFCEAPAVGLGQVPARQDRIRRTAEEILSLPEFRYFPRLNPEQTGQALSPGESATGVPRLKSSTGGKGRGEGDAPRPRTNRGGPGEPADNPQWRNNEGGIRNLPRGNRAGQNPLPQDVNEALGNDDLLPEVGEVENPLHNPDFDLDPPPRRDPLDQNDEDDEPEDPLKPADPNAPPHRQDPAQDPAGRDDDNDKPHEQRRADAQNAPDRLRSQPPQADKDQLPAPHPREWSGDRESLAVPRSQVSGLARVVGAVFHILAWTILSVICGLILWLIIQAIRNFERPRIFQSADGNAESTFGLQPEQAPGDLPADVYVAQARLLAEQGHYREAVQQLLFGALSHIERAGWVRFRRGLTVRDYLRAVRQHRAAYQALRAIIRVFEPLAFGRRDPTAEHFEKSLRGYEAGFGLD